jgi:hypothetical protein
MVYHGVWRLSLISFLNILIDLVFILLFLNRILPISLGPLGKIAKFVIALLHLLSLSVGVIYLGSGIDLVVVGAHHPCIVAHASASGLRLTRLLVHRLLHWWLSSPR